MARETQIGWVLGGIGVLLGAFALTRGRGGPSDDSGTLPGGEMEPVKPGYPPRPAYTPGLVWPLLRVPKKTIRASRKIGASRGSKDGKPKLHAGTDIGADAGRVVVAMEPGRIVNIFNGWSGGDTARMLIQGDSGYVENYAAISKGSWKEFDLHEGDRVYAGQPIARVGTYPGGSTMLHFELYEKGTTDNARWYEGDLPPNLRDSDQWLEWSEPLS